MCVHVIPVPFIDIHPMETWGRHSRVRHGTGIGPGGHGATDGGDDGACCGVHLIKLGKVNIMTTTTVKFNVSMDKEQMLLKNFKEVKFEVSFEGVEPSLIQRHAIANQVVAWQSQIRNNWDKFISGELPKVVTFGNTLFEGGRTRTVVKPVTEDDVRKFLAGKSPEEILAFFAQKGEEEELEEQGQEEEEQDDLEEEEV